jgi:hypothetical protein
MSQGLQPTKHHPTVNLLAIMPYMAGRFMYLAIQTSLMHRIVCFRTILRRLMVEPFTVVIILSTATHQIVYFRTILLR